MAFTVIGDVDKVLLLKELWERSKPAVFFANSGTQAPQWDEAEAKQAVLGYIDYFRGRLIKMDLSKRTMNTGAYDADNGEGTADKALFAAQTKMNTA